MGGIPEPPQPRSAFVTSLAWLSIVCAVLSAVGTIVQSLIISSVFSGPEMDMALTRGEAVGEMHSLFRSLYPKLKFYGFLSYVASGLTLAASIGMLRRRNWARILFIVVLIGGIFFNVASLFMINAAFADFATSPEAMMPPVLPAVITAAKWMVYGLVVVGTVLLVWIIRKLSVDPIRAEFTS